jgi:RND family efflux transporter MFP subunit
MSKHYLDTWLLTAACLLGAISLPAYALESVTLEPKAVSQSISLDGVVEAVRESTVAAQTGGTVTAIYYDVDDKVRPGSVIVEISDTEQQARLEQSQASVRAALANLRDTEQSFARIDEIYRKELASKAQYDQAKNQRDGAKATYNRAQSALKEAQKQMSYTKVIAPYGGIVIQRFVEIGEVVAPGSPLMAGIDLEQMRVNINLPQRYASTVRQHQLAEIALPDGKIVPARKLTIFPYADAQTHNFKVRLHLPERQAGLYPGMMVKVSLPIKTGQALLIPASALVVRSELRAVYVLDQEDQPRLRQIRTGYEKNGDIEVLSGLEIGDRIAINPNEALKQINAARTEHDA